MSNTKTSTCKLCRSPNIVKFGKYRGIQRWWCKDCHHKFADNAAPPRMKTPSIQVAMAIQMYYEGMRLNTIPWLVLKQYGTYVTHTSVFHWVTHFSEYVMQEAEEIQLNVGDKWVLDETEVRNPTTGRPLWLLDILDIDTHFLLATRQTYDRSLQDLKALVDLAAARAGKVSQEIYFAGSEKMLALLQSVIQDNQLPIEAIVLESQQYEIIETWRHIAYMRTKIMRRLRRKDTSQTILNGWWLHYNYFNPQIFLEGKTPAEAANTTCNLHNWSEAIGRRNPG